MTNHEQLGYVAFKEVSEDLDANGLDADQLRIPTTQHAGNLSHVG